MITGDSISGWKTMAHSKGETEEGSMQELSAKDKEPTEGVGAAAEGPVSTPGEGALLEPGKSWKPGREAS